MKTSVSRPAQRGRLALAVLAAGAIAAPTTALSAHAPVGMYKGVPVLGQIGPPEPSPTEPASFPKAAGAGWSCQGGKCSYTKVTGAAWSDCFVSYSPTHGGWLPTRYCR